MTSLQNSAKKLLRKAIQTKLRSVSQESICQQSARVTEKVLGMEAYKRAARVSVYLSTTGELSTIEMLKRMFADSKLVFVPTYEGDFMEMVQLRGMEDYEGLPLTKWNIKQPDFAEKRPNALETGGLDLILLPGVAFTADGGRCGHGRGYYDKYLKRHFDVFPDRNGENMSFAEKVEHGKTVLIGLALKEQIVTKDQLPLDEHDFKLDLVLYDECLSKDELKEL